MNVYWAIARLRRSGEYSQKRIEARDDRDACDRAEQWRREDLGNWEIIAVAKEVPMVETGIQRRSVD